MEQNNTMEKFILNVTHLHEHTHLIHGHEHVRMHTYIEDIDYIERSVFILKIAYRNFMRCVDSVGIRIL